MAFDASRQPDPDPQGGHEDEPIDYVDWAMRIAVFGPVLLLYTYWIWTVLRTAFVAIVSG